MHGIALYPANVKSRLKIVIFVFNILCGAVVKLPPHGL